MNCQQDSESAEKLVRSAEKQIGGSSQEIRALAASLDAVRGCETVNDRISKLEEENAALRIQNQDLQQTVHELHEEVGQLIGQIDGIKQFFRVDMADYVEMTDRRLEP